MEGKVGNKIIDLNQQVVGVGKDVESKADVYDLEELRDYVNNKLSPKGSNTRPIYIDEEGTKEVDGIVVPKDIISLTGGIAARGIADISIVKNEEIGSKVEVEQILEDGEPIANIVIDGETTTLYAPSCNYDDSDIRNELLTKVDKNSLRSKGSQIIPVYFDENADVKEVTGLRVANNIESTEGGVSAKGIADLTISGVGGSNVSVKTLQTNGTPIAEIVVDGEKNTIYSPESERYDDTEVRRLIDSKASQEDLDELQDRTSDIEDEVKQKLDKTIYEEHINNIKEKGSSKLPIYIDKDAKAQEVTSIEVLGDIVSLHGGVSARGIADLSNTKQGTDVKVTPLTTEGEAIANIEVDGIENIIYAPKADNSTKDNEQDARITYLESLFDDEGKVKDADKLDGKSKEELFDSLDANGGINLVIGGVSKSVTKSELLRMLGFDNKGSRSLPVYYENEELKEIDSLSVDGHIESLGGGVSARGIADFSVTTSGGSGGSNITVLKNNELEEVEYEDITHTASAYSTKLIKDIINVDEIDDFSSAVNYEAGVLVRYNNKIYQFTDNHKGNWDSGIVKRFKLNEIANPIAISNTELDYMFN